MMLSQLLAFATLVLFSAATAWKSPTGYNGPQPGYGHGPQRVAPKVLIIGLYSDEGEAWHHIPEFDLLAHNITVPGLSSIFPQAHCTADGQICQVVGGEGEINAANSIASVIQSHYFDLRKTYFLVAGVAGVNPEVAGVGSVTFARFLTQPDLEYEFDAREIPSNWTTGYVPQGSTQPGEYPSEIYGTECYEVNTKLRDLAIGFAKTAKLNDTADAAAFRATYAGYAPYAAGAQGPKVVACDVATADTYVSGRLLSEAWQNYTTLITNGKGLYCTTAQEDNAIAEAVLRGNLAGLTDFSRLIVMRTASDFDRQAPGTNPQVNLFTGYAGYEPALANIYHAGVKVVEGIVTHWESKFAAGIKPDNYVGDILGSLGGQPDYGPGSIFGGKGAFIDGAKSTTVRKVRPRRRYIG